MFPIKTIYCSKMAHFHKKCGVVKLSHEFEMTECLGPPLMLETGTTRSIVYYPARLLRAVLYPSAFAISIEINIIRYYNQLPNSTPRSVIQIHITSKTMS